MTENQQRVEIPSRLSEMAQVRRVAEQFFRESCGIAAEGALEQELLLVLTEAGCNVIKHAHGEDGRPFELELQWDAAQRLLTFVLTDSGRGFDLNAAMTKAKEAQEVTLGLSGRGLLLMDELVDEIDYVPRGDQSEENRLVLRKSIETPKQ